MRRLAPDSSMRDQTESTTRIKISHGCAAVGVALLMLASVLPSDWYPMVPLFLGLASIGASHVLTPCQDQITQWWRRQLRAPLSKQ